MKLDGKVAIVTGAGRGLGRASALCLAEEGADVAVCSRTLAEVEEVAKEVNALGRKSLAMKVDATDADQVAQLVQETMKTFGKVDILVNNAGGGGSVERKGKSPSIVDLMDEDWDNIYNLNLKSQVYFCRAVVPHMKVQKSGKIINLSSVAGKIGDNFQIPYSSIKGAVVLFTRALARELARDGINVNCICPGFIYTPAWERQSERLWKTVPAYQEMKEAKDVFLRRVSRLVPMQREQTLMIGGKKEVFERCQEVLNILGNNIIYVGENGMGLVVKLCFNMYALMNAVSAAETFAFGVKLGADAKTIFETINTARGGDWYLQRKCPVPGCTPDAPSNKDFEAQFFLELAAKDIGLVRTAMSATRTPLLMTSLTQQMFDAANNMGLGRKDSSAVSILVRQLAGLEEPGS